ncbi:UvrD-helicase domain-containing protein [Streptomyces albireticuli]|uniref:DNA 3'-5' helicase n=1 Tax=Streptomyces albireticuli TaxID=1940 RepID=A0A2A2D7B7_9ACTN|nr:UvrD-helicase domain-containing protein [Streptomyces albireticuli]MCD9142528.1 UvrD-helicase domain-containing protein [Streptomyces albireticuli]MCD9163928.1 UvrD-helicase domain-containing protein [Streptomyces albireticuli]MCD9192656.1 UvrD-helicase domain-containing protein [Streptomyces albireticuli]PAU47404.1 DNA helicase UvrD [Streptomyces albireticuli]
MSSSLPPGATRPSHPTGTYRLVRTRPGPSAPPELDARQRAVVDHGDGPLLVLAGPGTGKTTTLVEAVAERVRRGTDPERILVLTFSRKAAVELRDRMADRLGRLGGVQGPRATTFHSYCYALVRAHQDVDLFIDPLRLLSGPEQDTVVRELLAGQAELERAGRARVTWPDELRACLTTRGFADEVRAVLARSRELGLGPGALGDFAHRTGRPDWAAAASFLAEYLDVLDARGVLDYAELVHRAVLLAERAEVAADLALRYDAVFVDEYQDTDAAQARLLRALAGGGRTLIAFGDPDQSIYAFRGADVNGILEFPDAFPRRDGTPAPVEVLTTSRRSAAHVLAATRLLTARMPLTRLPARAVRAHRELAAVREGGRVEAYTYPTAGAEVDNIADILRRAHLEDGVPWHGMAVLVRAGARSLPALRRALTSAGVPVETDGDDIPLRHEPAVAPLLTALRAVAEAGAPTGAPEGAVPGAGEEEPAAGDARGAARTATPGAPGAVIADAHGEAAPAGADTGADTAGVQAPAGRGAYGPGRDAQAQDTGAAHAPGGTPGEGGVDSAAGMPVPEFSDASGGPGAPGADHPAPGEDVPADDAGTSWLDAETALALLTSPLGGMDGADLRRLGRALREEERAAGAEVPRPSDVLIAEALAEPERLAAHARSYARGAQVLGKLLRRVREILAAGGTAEEALWALWNGTRWPDRLQGAAHRGGAAGRNADRDLDAVCALFETAARAEDRTGGRGALNFLDELEAQDIAADVLTRKAVRPDAVRLMTAHRSKGLEWRLVVVAGVQEGLWPDLRRRGSLLEADRIGRDGLAEPLSPGALLAEERRLFYVAATRARDRLVVTAVKAAAEDGDQPSRFLAELGTEPVDVTQRPRRPLAVAALVAELRATTVDPAASDALRAAAAERLARLAALRDDEGQPLVPSAHPDRWWGLNEPTHSEVPLRDRDHPLALSGSALGQLAGGPGSCSLQWFLGREVKADAPATAAQGFGNVVHVLADEVASGRTPADLAVLMERLDSVWDALAFDAPWKSTQEKENARAALERFLRWHVMERGGRAAVATEHSFDVTLKAADHLVRIRGSMDRVEADRHGRAYVVDFKTGKSPVSAGDVERHPQLAVYQLAVEHGAVDDLFAGARPAAGGAELVQLRQGAAKRDGGDTVPKVQAQQPVGDGEWIGDLLAEAAGRVLEERFSPRPGQHCAHCSFRASCSARPEGRQIVE